MPHFRIAENRTFQVHGQEFLFLPTDKAIFEMDKDTASFMKKWSGIDALTEDLVFDDLEGSNEDKIDLLRYLAKMRVLSPVSSDQPKIAARVPQVGDVPLKNLILHVTEACNLKCSYCYYSEEDGQHLTLNGGKMPYSIATRAIDFLLEHSGDQNEVGVVFFGGEPLLNLKLIKAVVAYADDQGTRFGKKVTYSLTTNATLLTDETISFLRDHNVGVTISMDGAKSVHDRYRRFADGSPSYDIIEPKVRHLIASLGKPVPARVTLVKAPGDLTEALNHLRAMGFAEVGFSPVTSGCQEYQFSESAMDALLAQFKSLAEEYIRFALRGDYLGFSNLTDLLVSLHGQELKNYPCGAGLGLFSVSHQGRLFLCQRFTGQDKYCMGDLENGFDRTNLVDFREKAEISNKEECRHCWARTLCTGGCYHEACIRENDFLKPNLHYCRWIKRWIETGLEVYGQLSVRCPEYLDKLLMLRGQPFKC